MKKFNKSDLVYFDGKNGRPAYIAFEGKVYDVSASFLWRGGAHLVLHQAGRDLTEDLQHAPHGPELLSRVKQIGIL